MKVVVLQSNYLPWKGYFDLVHDADLFVFYDQAKYTKNDWRNRNRIYSKNGLQWLTIPIAKSAVKLKISEVRIEDPAWQEMHFRSLYYAYKRAPCFSSIEPLLEECYLQKRWVLLKDVNRFLVERVSRMLGIETRFADSEDYEISGGRVERLVHLLRLVGTSVYVSGPSAREYLDERKELFEEAGIRVVYKDYAGYPVYRQLQEPFEHAVSIVDLLANVGVERAPDYIWKWREGRG
jgi:hypothetical protein